VLSAIAFVNHTDNKEVGIGTSERNPTGTAWSKLYCCLL